MDEDRASVVIGLDNICKEVIEPGLLAYDYQNQRFIKLVMLQGQATFTAIPIGKFSIAIENSIISELKGRRTRISSKEVVVIELKPKDVARLEQLQAQGIVLKPNPTTPEEEYKRLYTRITKRRSRTRQKNESTI